MISVTINDRLLWAGLAGLVGALFTGIGEGLLQFSPGADYAAADYGYFAGIDANRQSLGYFLSILSAPLYLLGYWHLTRNLTPTRPRLGLFLFMLMAYAFMIANVWLGERFFLAQTVKAIAEGTATPELLVTFRQHHEPLVNILRGAIAIFSSIWIWLIVKGQSNYPRWMAFFSPLLILLLIFLLYFTSPDIGGLILPTAMNTAHVFVFGVSVLVLAFRKQPGPQTNQK